MSFGNWSHAGTLSLLQLAIAMNEGELSRNGALPPPLPPLPPLPLLPPLPPLPPAPPGVPPTPLAPAAPLAPLPELPPPELPLTPAPPPPVLAPAALVPPAPAPAAPLAPAPATVPAPPESLGEPESEELQASTPTSQAPSASSQRATEEAIRMPSCYIELEGSTTPSRPEPRRSRDTRCQNASRRTGKEGQTVWRSEPGLVNLPTAAGHESISDR